MSGELSAALCHAVNEWLLEYCLAQKERILGRNAVEFFGLDNLPEPSAVSAARASWTREAATEGALR